jgi:Uma2 family endonuclease
VPPGSCESGAANATALWSREMTAASRPRYTIQEYVKLEEYANLKHEYFEGQVWAMGGGTPEHARIASAITAALVAQLRGRRCAVYSSDARIRVVATGLDTYPDVTVICGREERDEGDVLALTNPVVLVEVTSDSSEAYDRGEKFAQYKQIPSLQEFVVVSHRERLVDVFRRAGDGSWAKSEGRSGGRVRLSSIACDFEVDDVYRDPFAG